MSSSSSSTSPSAAQQQSSYEVQLAVYDLSRGMARTLSAQWLGPQYAVDAVPHTGLVVYGIEYFFGSNSIQSQTPHLFRQATGMQPLQLLPLGRTHVSQHDFEQWCRTKIDDGTFHGTSYDLLRHNCNTFSHTAALQALRLPQGVPNWILQVPQRFQASPMGQVLVPMLEQMQLTTVVPGASSVVGADTADRAQYIRVGRPNTAAATLANTANRSSHGDCGTRFMARAGTPCSVLPRVHGCSTTGRCGRHRAPPRVPRVPRTPRAGAGRVRAARCHRGRRAR